MIDSYAWARGREAVVRMGPDHGPTVLILPPLFEEANRMRRILVQVMRGLAERSLGSALPDLPGTNESPVSTVDARFENWAEAVAFIAKSLPQPVVTVAIRGGALLDGFAQPLSRWRLSPETGKRVLRDMLRATALTGGVKVGDLEERARMTPERLAGNLIHPDLFIALETAEPDTVDARIAVIGDGIGVSDVTLPASPPWRRAEPEDDPVLIAAMVDDIAIWAESCAAR